MIASTCRCRPTHRGAPLDGNTLLPPSLFRDARAQFPFLIVLGYTPRFMWKGGLHPRLVARLEQARRDLLGGVAAVAIVTGGAIHSPDNEAVMMREWLLAHGIEPARVIAEPCARHTTTNLRNAGRIVLAEGEREALIVTTREQALYVGRPWRSSFHLRCLIELGYLVGEIEWRDPMHVVYRPSNQVFRQSWKETRAGDP